MTLHYYRNIVIATLILTTLQGCKSSKKKADVQSMISAMEGQQSDVRIQQEQFPAFIAFSDWLFGVNVGDQEVKQKARSLINTQQTQDAQPVPATKIKTQQLHKALASFSEFAFTDYIQQEIDRVTRLERAIASSDVAALETALNEDIDTYYDVLAAALHATVPETLYQPKTNDLFAAAIVAKTRQDPRYVSKVFGGFFIQFSNDKERVKKALNGTSDESQEAVLQHMYDLYYGPGVTALLAGGLEAQKRRYRDHITAIYTEKLKKSTDKAVLLLRVSKYKQALMQLAQGIHSDGKASLVAGGALPYILGGLVAVAALYAAWDYLDDDAEDETPLNSNKLKPKQFVTVGVAGFSAAHDESKRGTLETLTGVGQFGSGVWDSLPTANGTTVVQHYKLTHFEDDAIFNRIIAHFKCQNAVQTTPIGLLVMANSWGAAAGARLAKQYRKECGRRVDLFIMVDGVNKRTLPPIWSFRDPIEAEHCINFFQTCDFTSGTKIPQCQNEDLSKQCPYENGVLQNHIWIQGHGAALAKEHMLRFMGPGSPRFNAW